MIQVKTFTGWKLVSEETARTLVKHWLNGIITMNTIKKIDYINNKKLKGITIEELLGE